MPHLERSALADSAACHDILSVIKNHSLPRGHGADRFFKNRMELVLSCPLYHAPLSPVGISYLGLQSCRLFQIFDSHKICPVTHKFPGKHIFIADHHFIGQRPQPGYKNRMPHGKP